MTHTKKEIRDVLLNAAKSIVQPGAWIQRYIQTTGSGMGGLRFFRGDDHPDNRHMLPVWSTIPDDVCAGCALTRIANEAMGDDLLAFKAAKAAGKHLGDGLKAVISYNDQDGMRASTVASMLRQAAKTV